MKGSPGLYEFLQEAELVHTYNSLKNILQVHNVGQLKYVTDDDLANIGLSKPECRRLKSFFNKYSTPNYASKLRKFLGRKEESRDEFLLADEILGNKGAIKVPSQHVIQSESVSVYKELGEGEFGVVQQGVWTDEDGMRHQVAVKCLSKKRMQNNTVEFMKEYEIMQTIDHNNIVRLYGVVLDDTSSQIMLVTELAPLRSLLECLKEPSLRATFTVACLAAFCQQICHGMMYLEDKRLIHRDLAARNILVFSKSLVKISDFGLSRALGVGKDYYQTNFNVNLKLPIAWCAPECINFLKFTSASDVWAFGVTMWEMFSYGFQPWAALTGHQILEAIDEPEGQRLEQPVHCPREHYAIMEATWTHRPDDRPTFSQLCAMLEEARPDQVQVIVPGGGTGLLQYDVGDILTVVDKHCKQTLSGAGGTLWNGVNAQGKVGLFHPSHTVTYLGSLPGSAGTVPPPQWGPMSPPAESGGGSSMAATNLFQRSTLRTSKDRSGGGSRRKISRDMISAPTGQVHHTGHVGPDGNCFGDITFISGTNGNLTIGGGTVAGSGSIGVGGAGASGSGPVAGSSSSRLPSTGSDNGFPSWSRADSEASESAPLISSAGSSGGKMTTEVKQVQPRMGHAIGYLRRPEKEEPTVQHQYHSISDEENEAFGSPLDLGPSLMDEVFGELENYDTLKLGKLTTSESAASADKKNAVTDEEHHAAGLHGIVESCHKLADKVSTLTLSRRHKGKKAAFVKPIKASDERTLENAILMANQIASKSMHDLDKRCTDDMFNTSPQVSPLTLNSPSKKFTFKFPVHKNRSSSPPTRHFTDEVNSRAEMNSMITPAARDAYKALIEGDKPSTGKADAPMSVPSPTNNGRRLSLPPSSSVFSLSRVGEFESGGSTVSPPCVVEEEEGAVERNLQPPSLSATVIVSSVSNPLPLPPKDRKSSVGAGKRHIRKNPLIIPGGVAASMVRRVEHDSEKSSINHQPPKPEHIANTVTRAFAAVQPAMKPPVGGPANNNNSSSATTNFETYNNAFEDEIAYSIDALDNIQESRHNSPKSSVDNQTSAGVSGSVGYGTARRLPNTTDGNAEVSAAASWERRHSRDRSPEWNTRERRGVDSDEVRIMSKVLGGVSCDKEDCLAALKITDWNVHKAIKMVKCRGLVMNPGVTDSELKISLMNADWDVIRAASLLK